MSIITKLIKKLSSDQIEPIDIKTLSDDVIDDLLNWCFDYHPKNGSILFCIGYIYMNYYTSADAEIEKYFKRAVKLENEHAMVYLGYMYHCDKDYEVAKELYKKAYLLGNAKACYYLGILYMKNYISTSDKNKYIAAKYFSFAYSLSKNNRLIKKCIKKIQNIFPGGNLKEIVDRHTKLLKIPQNNKMEKIVDVLNQNITDLKEEMQKLKEANEKLATDLQFGPDSYTAKIAELRFYNSATMIQSKNKLTKDEDYGGL
ncbi:MAG: hypothetical protein Edafosvirus13_12 [Edafosvirus sp.]|uniref:Sel1 repeat family protein n=1 Tax=Edafosvirus sp. TaxID=2487765 RepID=A0A3G4ZU77_9VIRU|nr:MAG: hypothetical protein Edafosvirus13_12 [Edafosvirus sp.]